MKHYGARPSSRTLPPGLFIYELFGRALQPYSTTAGERRRDRRGVGRQSNRQFRSALRGVRIHAALKRQDSNKLPASRRSNIAIRRVGWVPQSPRSARTRRVEESGNRRRGTRLWLRPPRRAVARTCSWRVFLSVPSFYAMDGEGRESAMSDPSPMSPITARNPG